MTRRRTRGWASLLLAAPVAPLLPDPWAAVLLALVIGGWLWRRPPRREATVAGSLLVLAVFALALEAAFVLFLQRDLSERQGAAEAGYDRLWTDLEEPAREAAKLLPGPVAAGDRLQAFGLLDRLARRRPQDQLTLLLLDPDGEASAWAGVGLLHDLDSERLPSAGLAYAASYTAVTLMAVEPLSAERRPWRVVVGRSLSTDRLPFPFGLPGEIHWTLVGPRQPAVGGGIELSRRGAPTMVIQRPPERAQTVGLGGWLPGRRAAWGLIGLGLLALVGLRLAVGGRTGGEGGRWLEPAMLAAAGVCSCGLAAGVSVPVLIALGGGILLGGLGLAVAPRWQGRLGAAVWGVVAAAGLAVLALCLRRWTGAVDLGSELGGSAGQVALRLALFAAAFGLLAVGGWRAAGGERDRWLWLGVALLLAAGSCHDLPTLALPLLACGAAATSLWMSSCGRTDRPIALALVCLVAALASAAAWETAHRWLLRHELEADLLAEMAPPSAAELEEERNRVEEFFSGLRLTDLAPRSPLGLEAQDLAFALWRHSPLARRGALSALVVEPGAGPVSRFSFGLPLTDAAELDRSAPSVEELLLPGWEDAWVIGEAGLRLDGRPWGAVRYWLLMRPGFRLQPTGLEELTAGLLRGEPAVSRPAEDLPGGAGFALYSRSGRAVLTPWREAPQLPVEIERDPAAVVATPAGRAWAFAHRAAYGTELVFLPLLDPTAALGRVGIHALGALVPVGLGAVLGLFLALSRPSFRRALGRAARSYSKRLVLVFTGLLLIPLLLVNIVLLRVVEQRLVREQTAAGVAALDSAQRVLGDYVLTLEPGFGIETALDDDLLGWLSGVVHHELNLYWGSSVYASSKPELFTAGLLPKRIPGEVFSRLSLLGYELSSRTNRVGGANYLELYAPLKIPGAPAQEKLILSMPLLAQQEEVAAEVATLRNQAILVTAFLLVVLVAVGNRLARNFTSPLMELIRGTQRIAAGAASVELTPTEPELAALVEAVDQMAARIAEARSRLVREKQVIERMVEHITAGVVSLDQAGRILMRNRVAAGLLGARVGEPLDETLGRDARLAPIRSFLAGVESAPAQQTVRLADPGGGEREWTLVWVPLPGRGEPAALLVVEDVTEVLRGQRLQAWAEMARMIAHEIKNPLTPIQLSAEHMREVYAGDPVHFDRVFESCTANILRQVEELRQIAGEFSTYSQISRVEPKRGDLVAMLREVVDAYRAAPPAGVHIELDSDRGTLPARFDSKLLGRALRNLLENALRATRRGGTVRIELRGDGGQASITVSDDGPGVAPETLPRIFEPYFSTHAGGTGLGLPIARRIVEEHGGRLVAHNREGGGLTVSISLPLDKAEVGGAPA